MIGKKCFFLILVVGMVFSVGAVARPLRCDPSTHGHEIPFPFDTTAVELANKEPYVLVGMLQTKDNEVKFLADLNKMPWLANAERREDPRYPVIGSARQYEKYNGLYVQIEAEAVGMIVDAPNGKKKYSIFLKIFRTPTVLY